ncbi:metal ABC transporter ATP-binding protein [Candidatus Sumerlaeota bacterium]|nr:metal ABC transporter ATP-binding protein [Candidatus Sumerlaeota bacterium]
MTAAVEVENLTVRFGSVTALEDVSFTLKEGGFLAVLGPNGAGKSTLLKTLTGLIEPTQGSVRIAGNDARRRDSLAVSYVPQLKTIDRQFPALALELVVSGLLRRWPWRISKDDEVRATAAMKSAGVADVARTPIEHLSGGQLQRVYLARGMVRNPRLLILDEPASGIDTTGEGEFYHLLEHYQHDHPNATIVMITHDWSVARHHASDVLLLNRRVVGFGNPDAILKDELLRDAYGHRGHKHTMQVGS